MTTDYEKRASQAYADIMGEVKVRIRAINAVGNGPIRNDLPSPVIREFCYLQTRMICELIALACLAAHGDMADLMNKTVEDEWSAHKILKRLESLHPNFFPERIEILSKSGMNHINVLHDETCMSKEEFLQLYYKCDKNLHRGSIKKLMGDRTPLQHDFPEISKPLQRLVDLLSSHIVYTPSQERIFIVHLSNALEGGKVSVGIGKPPQPHS